METIETLENGKELNLYDVSDRQSGYGHKTITVELEYDDHYKEFSRTTNNMPGYDEAMDIEDYEERKLALYGLISGRIEDSVYEWIEELDSENENVIKLSFSHNKNTVDVYGYNKKEDRVLSVRDVDAELFLKHFDYGTTIYDPSIDPVDEETITSFLEEISK